MTASIIQKTALYRHFNIEGKLLYVGISYSPIKRFEAHIRDSKWAEEARTISVEWFDSRKEALKSETKAIKKEKPLHNITHNNSRIQDRLKPIDESFDAVFNSIIKTIGDNFCLIDIETGERSLFNKSIADEMRMLSEWDHLQSRGRNDEVVA